ncbi:fimbria/pilus outer membrane usher protein [Comamonas humi]
MTGLAAALPLVAAAADAPSFSASALPPVKPAPARGQPSARSAGIPLYLSVQLNQRDMGLQAALWRADALWMQRATLTGLGIRPERLPPPGTADDGWVALEAMPGLSVQYRAATQDATLQLPFDWLTWPRTDITSVDTSSPAASSSTGLLFNYDLYGAQSSSRQGGVGALTELRAFGANAVLNSTLMSQYGWGGDDSAGQQQPRNVRLDTTWSRSDPERMLSLRVGDTLTGALPWTRATRIGGIQIARNFRLQPYRVTTPVPALMGTSALPSDIQLFVNGVQQYRGAIPAGPFAVNTPTGIIGAGNAQLVLTDAFGRATTLQYSFYGTDALLAKGLSDWSAELGWVRRDYGWRSWSYGSTPVASGTWRSGLSDTFTLQSHGEATSHLANAGVGAAWQIGPAGVLSAAAAGSRYAGTTGHQLQLEHSWNRAPFYTSIQATRASGDYRDAASLYDTTHRKSSARALVGYSSSALGNFSVGTWYLNTAAYDHSPYAGGSDASTNPLSPVLQPAYTTGAQRYVTLNWSKPIGRMGFASLAVNHNVQDHRASSVQLGFTWLLDGNVNTGVSFDRQNQHQMATAFASQATPSDTGWGWSASTRAGAGGGAQARVEYQGEHYRANGSVASYAGVSTAALGASGSVAWLGGHAFASRRIDDSFAVVSTSGVAHVPVKRENNVIGHTDGQGLLLVPQLQAYQRNQLAIDTLGLPAQMRIAQTQKIVTPTDRAGMLVAFDIQMLRSATVLLTDGQGTVLPVGSVVTVTPAGGSASGQPSVTSALVGIDGAAYVENLPTRALLQAVLPDGRQCQARLDAPEIAPTDIPVLGPLACTARTSP